MGREVFMRTEMFKLVKAFLERRGIEMDEVRSINLGADAVLATITVELIYGEIERPAPEPSTLSIDRAGQVRITDEAIHAVTALQHRGATVRAQIHTALEELGFEVIL